MNFNRSIPALFLAGALGLSGCAQYASVSVKKPEFRPIPTTVGSLASVEQQIASAPRREKRDPAAALGELLRAARTASERLRVDPRDPAALADYNFAVARVFTVLRRA